MNRYGRSARQHWMTHAPSRMAALPDPEEFFTGLGVLVQGQVSDLTRRLAGPDPAGETYLQKVARLATARRDPPCPGRRTPPPLPASLQPDALDLDRVRSWRSGLPPAVSDALFTDCVRQLRDMVTAVQAALERHSAAALKQATHAMAGVAGNYGLSGLAAAVRSVADGPDALPPDGQAARLCQEIDRAEATMAALAEGESV